MTVITDFSANQMYKDSDLNEVSAVLPNGNAEFYFGQIYDWSKIFVEKRIIDPEKYFELFE
ncbi:hypothetical protein [Planococcus shenhongbingii]|uniref:hypothetical protein n=1 Tax=Planococcus shenhongbingii TaxID=3058398 RepID=UPI002659AF60|nr:hypothetical protein [Planococcus sp. N017]